MGQCPRPRWQAKVHAQKGGSGRGERLDWRGGVGLILFRHAACCPEPIWRGLRGARSKTRLPGQWAGGPVERQWGERLALAVPAQHGIAERWKCVLFWQELADLKSSVTTPGTGQSIRTTNLHRLLDGWHRRAGRAPRSLRERARWSALYAAGLDLDTGPAMLAAMCNLYRLHSPVEAVAGLFDARADTGLNAATDVYPGYQGLVVTGGRVRAMTWGFPVVLKGKSGQPLKPKPVNNARFDKLHGFWRRWATAPAHRCLIPLNAYAEAVGKPGSKTRTWLSGGGERPVFAWAGLWRPSAEWGDCYTGVMTDNAPELAHIHDRSPVLIEREDWAAWLTEPLPALSRFDRPYPAERLVIEATADRWAARSGRAA